MRELGESIWLHEQENLPAMTSRVIVRLANGGLWIHSPPELTPDLSEELRVLGDVEALVAANNAHTRFITQWQAAFPDATCFVAEGIPPKLPALKDFQLINDIDPSRWAADFQMATLTAVPLFDETVFLHRPSRTLIVTDLVQHYPTPTSFAQKCIFGPMGWQGICPPPPMRFDFVVHDRKALMAFVDEVASWDFDHIAVTHGRIIENDGKQVFAEIRERIRTERSRFPGHGFLMRQVLNRIVTGGLPAPRENNASQPET
jgi:hypothetical protein